MTKSEFGYFCAGMAAGAMGHKFYPQMKEKLAPYLAGAMVFAQEAFGDAMKDAMDAVSSMQQGAEPSVADIVSARPDASKAGPGGPAGSAAA